MFLPHVIDDVTTLKFMLCFPTNQKCWKLCGSLTTTKTKTFSERFILFCTKELLCYTLHGSSGERESSLQDDLCTRSLEKIFYFYNSSSFYLFKLIGLTGVSVPSEIKRFNCMTPISVSGRSITVQCLNVSPSVITCRLLSSKFFLEPRTAVSIRAATAKTPRAYNREAQGQADGKGRDRKDEVFLLWSELSRTWGSVKRSSLPLLSGSPLLGPWTAPSQHAPEEPVCHVPCLTRKDTKALSAENRDNFHKHTQMFAEGLCGTRWCTGKESEHPRQGQKLHSMPLMPPGSSFLTLFFW